MKPDESIGTLFQMLVDTRIPLAVVDDNGKLLGTIVKTQVLAALADAQPDKEDAEAGDGEGETEPTQAQETAEAKVGA